MKHFTHLFRVLTLCLVTLISSGAWATVQTYQKVTSAPTDWSGEYLIVYEAGNCAMDGSLTTLDAVSNTQAVTITNNTISLDDSYSFTIAPMDEYYSIQAKSGKYMGNASNSNGLTSSDKALANTLSLSADGSVDIVSSGGAYLRYNPNSGQTRFRYFKASTYTSQKAIQLYKKASTTPSTDPSISASNVKIDADATSGAIEYTINNPVTGKTLTATTDASWITITQVTDEKVTFTTTANTGAERTATITLKYEGADDKDVTVTQAKAVIQYTITWSVNGETRQETYAEGEAINFAPATVPAGFTDYVFRGWITNATVEGTTEPTYVTEATATADVTYYAVFAKKTTTGGSGDYELVTENQSDWSGDYLIAYSEYVFADGREGGDKKMGAASSSVAPGENLSNNTVAASWGDQYKVALEEVSEGSGTYVLVTQDGKYNYYTSNSANGLSATDDKETAAKYPISVNFVSASDVQLALGGAATGSIFHYNSTASGKMFRFYKNGTQSPVYLYKKQEGTITYSDFCTILPAGLPVVIGSTGYATFYDRDNRIIPTGVKAYYCTQGEEGVLNTVQITNLSYIPRWTGVILEGTPGTYYLEEIPTIMADEEETDKIMDDGVLDGTIDDMSVEDLRAELGDYPVYVFSKVNDRLGFYKFTGDTLAGRKAFYVNANALVSGFILDFEGTEGINSVISATNLKAGYDIQGRKLNKMQKGINILGGKKIIK